MAEYCKAEKQFRVQYFRKLLSIRAVHEDRGADSGFVTVIYISRHGTNIIITKL